MMLMKANDRNNLFIRFLKESKCYAAYRKNVIDIRGKSIEDKNLLFLRISTAFEWTKTEQGIGYWLYLQELWNLMFAELNMG